MTLLKLTEIIQDVQAYLREFTSVVCLWKTGFYLIMGLKKKKKGFIRACKTISRCYLVCCGWKRSRWREKAYSLCKVFVFFPPSWCL